MKRLLQSFLLLIMVSCSSPATPVIEEEVETACTGYQWYGESVEDFSTIESLEAYQEVYPDEFMSLSPDETLFAYTFFPDAYLYDWENQSKIRLFGVIHENAWGSVYEPIWSDDGSKLAFVLDGSRCSEAGETEIIVITLDPNDFTQSQWQIYDASVGISVSDQAPYPTLFEFETNDSIKYSTCSNYNADEDCPELRLEL